MNKIIISISGLTDEQKEFMEKNIQLDANDQFSDICSLVNCDDIKDCNVCPFDSYMNDSASITIFTKEVGYVEFNEIKEQNAIINNLREEIVKLKDAIYKIQNRDLFERIRNRKFE